MTEESKLKKKVAELEGQIRQLEHDLIHDSLTKLKTRAFFEEELGIYLSATQHPHKEKRKERLGFRNFSIIFFDIDHFKKVNDTFGHDTGDMVLKNVAGTIQSHLRTGDTVARWGGEEMVVNLLGANEEDAVKKADAIRQEISGLEFPELPELKITVSAGVATGSDGLTSKELIKRSDKALYAAKKGGRNKVMAYSEII